MYLALPNLVEDQGNLKGSELSRELDEAVSRNSEAAVGGVLIAAPPGSASPPNNLNAT